MTFPDCPNYPKLTTLWKPVDCDGRILHVTELAESEMRPSRVSTPQLPEYHLTEARLIAMALEPKYIPAIEEETHLEHCSYCFKKLVELIKKFAEN